MQYTRFASDENRVPQLSPPSRFAGDENVATQTLKPSTTQLASHRVALGDVTSQVNKQTHRNVSSVSGVYKAPAQAQVQVEHTSQRPISPSTTSYSPKSERSSNNTIHADHDEDIHEDVSEDVNEEEDEDDASSTSHSNEPLLLVSTEESTRAVQLAYQDLYSDTPDPLDEDTYDLVMVVEYSHEVFQYLHELEEKYKPHPRYMHFQPELKWSYRATLIDWIVQVHARFQLLPETLYLTVNIIDRFLSQKTVTLNRFQLVGAAALFLAAKFEEINCPTLKEILYMLDNSYTKDELLKAERYMINTLKFELGWPGPMSFLRRVSKADDYEYDIRTLAKYLLETTIMDSRLVSAQPSWLAAGAYYLSRVILGFNNWTEHHVFYSGYTAEQLFPLATVILENCRHASKRHQAIFEKYSERRHRRSSQVVARWIALAEQRVS